MIGYSQVPVQPEGRDYTGCDGIERARYTTRSIPLCLFCTVDL